MNAANQGWLVARRGCANGPGPGASDQRAADAARRRRHGRAPRHARHSADHQGRRHHRYNIASVRASALQRGRLGDAALHLRRFDTAAAGEKALRDQNIDVLVVDGRRLEWRERRIPELQALITGAIQVSTVQHRAAAAGD